RRTYTGTRLIFNLIFLAFFFVPMAAKVFFWMEVSRLEDKFSTLASAVDGLSNDFERSSSQVGRDMALAVRRAMARVPILRKDSQNSGALVIDQMLLRQLAAHLKTEPGEIGPLLGSGIESSLAASAPVKNIRQVLDRVADELARRPGAEAHE